LTVAQQHATYETMTVVVEANEDHIVKSIRDNGEAGWQFCNVLSRFQQADMPIMQGGQIIRVERQTITSAVVVFQRPKLDPTPAQ
jgi:DNA topoisomerase IA